MDVTVKPPPAATPGPPSDEPMSWRCDGSDVVGGGAKASTTTTDDDVLSEPLQRKVAAPMVSSSLAMLLWLGGAQTSNDDVEFGRSCRVVWRQVCDGR